MKGNEYYCSGQSFLMNLFANYIVKGNNVNVLTAFAGDFDNQG